MKRFAALLTLQLLVIAALWWLAWDTRQQQDLVAAQLAAMTERQHATEQVIIDLPQRWYKRQGDAPR